MKTETKKYLKIGVGILLLYLCIHYWDKLAGVLRLCSPPHLRCSSAV